MYNFNYRFGTTEVIFSKKYSLRIHFMYYVTEPKRQRNRERARDSWQKETVKKKGINDIIP